MKLPTTRRENLLSCHSKYKLFGRVVECFGDKLAVSLRMEIPGKIVQSMWETPPDGAIIADNWILFQDDIIALHKFLGEVIDEHRSHQQVP